MSKDTLSVANPRSGLPRTRSAIANANGELTVGFIGGSITDSRSGHNWPEYVVNWLVDRYPDTRIVVENAAIGATGSALAVFRAQRDLIDHDCDLVFIEYAVNDLGVDRQQRFRSREGLVRKLLADGERDLVFAYTFSQPMYPAYCEGALHQSIVDFETLADHYGISSVNMGLHALQSVRAGKLRWDVWLPDGLHPQHTGSQCYADRINGFLESQLGDNASEAAIPAGEHLPTARDPLNWETAQRRSLATVETRGPWSLRRWAMNEWIDQVLLTTAPGASLAFEFEGRGLALGFDFGKRAADFRYRLDDGDWQPSNLDRPEWCGDEGWFRLCVISDELEPGPHRCEVQVNHAGEGTLGCNFRLGLVGVL